MTSLILLLTLTSVDDGSIVFVENSNRIVEQHTGSSFTHVGIIFKDEEGTPWVYEATKPKVHKVKLSEFKQKKRAKVQILNPKISYSIDEIKEMKSYLDDQLGRRYSVKGYVFDTQVRGIHCSELVANALNKTKRYHFSDPWNVTPGLLHDRVKDDYTK